jgi:hypothetical protein
MIHHTWSHLTGSAGELVLVQVRLLVSLQAVRKIKPLSTFIALENILLRLVLPLLGQFSKLPEITLKRLKT